MGNKTPLFVRHETLGAKIVDFGGWDMPIHYGSQIEEHHVVRQSAGVFDVSHMTVLEVHGSDRIAFLDRLLANDIQHIKEPGQAMYSAMCNEEGGVLDDLIVYNTGEPMLVVVNCATREKDINWMNQVADDFDCRIVERDELAILAIQGPNAMAQVQQVVSEAMAAVIDHLKVFQGAWVEKWFIARTGYTGEKGLEILLPASEAVAFWDALLEVGVRPIGLGARDTLRLEAGMNLYGSDMDETTTPLESNMASTVHLDGRDFVGSASLRQQQSQSDHAQLVGLVLSGKGVLRAHYPVFNGRQQIGEVTSGAFSPTLQKGIALARVQLAPDEDTRQLAVEIRGKMMPVVLVRPPFVRNGKQVYKT